MLLKSNTFQYKERVPKILIVTSSYSAKKGTHVSSYTLLLHEKIATFLWASAEGVEVWLSRIFIHIDTANVLFNVSTRFVKTSQPS